MVYAGYTPPGIYARVYTPGYTNHPTAQRTRHDVQTGSSGVQALERGVTEQTVSDAGVTVRPALPSPVSLLVVVLPEAQRGLFLPKNC